MSSAGTEVGSTRLAEAFADVVCEDQELVDAEFASIIAANGFDAQAPKSTRPSQPRPWWGDGPEPVQPGRVVTSTCPGLPVHAPGRQRSPPVPLPAPTDL